MEMVKTDMPDLQRRLKTVSRSMYLSFAVLPRALRAPMGLAYLLCRAADTIADGTLLPVIERRQWLSHYRNLFQNFPFQLEPSEELCNEMTTVKFTDDTADQALLQNLSDCFRELARQPRTDQALIGNVVRAVVEGMELDLQAFDDESAPKSLSTWNDFERYIRLIGGEPGRFWAEMSLAHVAGLLSTQREKWIQSGVNLGAGLQMVNILRDVPADLKRGRCYIPQELLTNHRLTVDQIAPPMADDEKAAPVAIIPHLIEDQFRALYTDLIELARKKLLSGLDYLNEIPRRYWGLRAAVAWPMLIGLETLKRLQESPSILNSRERVKVSRKEIYGLLLTTAPLLPFQRWIENKARSIN